MTTQVLNQGVDGRDGNGYMFWPPRDDGHSRILVVVLAFIAVIGGLVPAGLALYYGSVRSNLQYVIDDRGLSVQYGVGRIDIPADDIASIGYVPQPPRMTRVGGAGMSGLQMGWYRLEDQGRIYRLTTMGQNIVFVDTSPDATVARSDTRYAFNPSNPQRFVQLLEDVKAGRALDAGPARAMTFNPVPSHRNEWWLVPVLIMIIVFPVGIGLPWIVHRSRRGMSYHVGPRGITVHHMGTKLYRWNAVHSVEVVREELPRMGRIFGASMPGYYAGRFSAGRLGTVQVNATRIKPPVVLVETTRDKLLLSPRDMDGFLQAVERYRGPAS